MYVLLYFNILFCLPYHSKRSEFTLKKTLALVVIWTISFHLRMCACGARISLYIWFFSLVCYVRSNVLYVVIFSPQVIKHRHSAALLARHSIASIHTTNLPVIPLHHLHFATTYRYHPARRARAFGWLWRRKRTTSSLADFCSVTLHRRLLNTWQITLLFTPRLHSPCA